MAYKDFLPSRSPLIPGILWVFWMFEEQWNWVCSIGQAHTIYLLISWASVYIWGAVSLYTQQGAGLEFAYLQLYIKFLSQGGFPSGAWVPQTTSQPFPKSTANSYRLSEEGKVTQLPFCIDISIRFQPSQHSFPFDTFLIVFFLYFPPIHRMIREKHVPWRLYYSSLSENLFEACTASSYSTSTWWLIKYL